MSQIAVGKPVPAFSAASTQGETSLNCLKGHKAVLYFYPKDNTPGCTTEAQDFRDLYQQFVDAGCQVIGISRDSLKSHSGFTEKQALPFPLISDPDETLCELFGVMKMKNMYGKQVRGIERSTFLIGTDGVLLREWRGVRVPGHADEVLQAVQEHT
ncbi:redoxin domain-containing protein [Pusillimonas sp. TS35]|uniref:peroxiredoxin n=1 Tax=Paracandidimonas lactea TaxID=2895524 RepID=UPI0013695727|nr:peroxiredoxin [Paracandidimonas lactea]MYN13822.1 redoxin domain-containing protein [Pusillimonas sp. TS35]